MCVHVKQVLSGRLVAVLLEQICTSGYAALAEDCVRACACMRVRVSGCVCEGGKVLAAGTPLTDGRVEPNSVGTVK